MLQLPYELSIYDSIFYELRMGYVKTNDARLSLMCKQLETLQNVIKNSSTDYASICTQARLMTESGCASLLSLFPEIKTQIRILLEDPQSSTYAQIQKFGSFFHDKQLSDPFLFANGKKFVQYLNMLRQIGNLPTHIATADVNVFDAVTTIVASIQVAALLLDFSFTAPVQEYEEDDDEQEELDHLHLTSHPYVPSPRVVPIQPPHHQSTDRSSNQTPPQLTIFDQPSLFSLYSPLSGLSSSPGHFSSFSIPPGSFSPPSSAAPSPSSSFGSLPPLASNWNSAPPTKQPSPLSPTSATQLQQQSSQQQQQPQSPSSQQSSSYQPYLAVLTRPAPAQPSAPAKPAPSVVVAPPHHAHQNGFTTHHATSNGTISGSGYHNNMNNGGSIPAVVVPNGTAAVNSGTTSSAPASSSSSSAPASSSSSHSSQKNYETSHLWVRNVDISIDKTALSTRFQALVGKDVIQNIYVNTPERENPSYYTAYVNFKTVDAAAKAKNGLDGVQLGSRKVTIQFNECPSLLKKGKMCISCKIQNEAKGKVTWSKYWMMNNTPAKK